MRRQVYNFFEDLDKKNLQRHNNSIVITSEILANAEKPYRNIKKTTLDETPCYIKSWNGMNSIYSIASSEMYKDLGILTPPISIGERNNNNKDYCLKYYTISEDVLNLKNLDVVLASNIREYKNIKRTFSYRNFKWGLLYDKTLREEFLAFMTEDCLNELINVYLADELRTDCDRHLDNFFLYKSPNSDRYEGVIPIDLEAGLICSYSDNFWGDFNTYLCTPLQTYTPTGGVDDTNYKNRIKAIRELLDDGVLGEDNIQLLKDVIDYEFPSTIKETCNKHHIQDRGYTVQLPKITETLWEYNHLNLGKDLGL